MFGVNICRRAGRSIYGGSRDMTLQTVQLDELAYTPDSGTLFERLRDLPGAALLDSCHPFSDRGRFDILVAEPLAASPPVLPFDATETESVRWFGELARWQRENLGSVHPVAEELPFCGGLLGILDYDAGQGLNKLPAHPGSRSSVTRVRGYRWAVLQDHLRRKTVLASLPGVSRSERDSLLSRLRQPARLANGDFRLEETFRSNFSEGEYRTAFARIQAYIQAGDCYQVNLAQRFSAACSGDPWQAYKRLRELAAAPFSAYLELDDDTAVLSLSPERFLSLHGHRVETSPIKGTRPRYRDRESDELARQELRQSEKDRAENLMIVDLLRNDLGRSCSPGSIHVDRLFEIQSYPTVHHLVSTITGELAPGLGAVDLLRASFPGGSITGAPKRRAMEIIAELEPDPRQVYCGSIFYVSADGRMDSNIAIRTLLFDNGQAHCWGGGGIVADSQWQQEYQETYDKVGRFLACLEEMR